MSPKVSIVIPAYNVERYIENMLRSVMAQKFTDYEAIIINDGSTDNTRSVIEKTIAGDDRFQLINQENKGPGGARNTGLDYSQGEYVCFFDPDDFVPDNGVKDLYERANEKDADIVIGIMELRNQGEVYSMWSVRNLAGKEEISPLDRSLNYSWSACHKMYRRSVIEDNHIRFPDYRRSEDGVFNFDVIACSNRITGCNKVIYHYLKRPFADGTSLTQCMTRETLQDVINVKDDIERDINKTFNRILTELIARNANSGEIQELKSDHRMMVSTLYVKYAKTCLISEFYRHLWTIDETIISDIERELKLAESRAYAGEWNQSVVKESSDLCLKGKLPGKRDLAREPFATVVVKSTVGTEKINQLLGSLYNQMFPSFEVIVDAKLMDAVDESFRQQVNFHESGIEPKGNWVVIVDEPISFTPHVLMDIYDKKVIGKEGKATTTTSELTENVHSTETERTGKKKQEENKYRRGIKRRLRKLKRNTLHFIELKIIYPRSYAHCKGRPIDKNKILLVETKGSTMPEAMGIFKEQLQAAGNFNIVEHCLGTNVAKHNEKTKRIKAFLDDAATTAYIFLTDICEPLDGVKLNKDTKVIQLWHGCGAFKKFGYSTGKKKFGATYKKKEKYRHYQNTDIVTVSSPEVIWAYEEAMNLHDGQVKALGIYRTDVFYDSRYITKAREKVRASIPGIGDRKVILYAPTFRGNIRNAKSPDRLEILRMAETLGDDYVLLIKHHPFVKKRPGIQKYCKDSFAFDVTDEMDIRDLICAADICISDYSSLVFEYSLLERPMCFFAYDLDDYDDWRGFYYDYSELTPGPVFRTTSEIIDYILEIESMFDKNKVIQFKEKFMSSCDGYSTERIISILKDNK